MTVMHHEGCKSLSFLCRRSSYLKEIKQLNKPECIYLCSFLFYWNKGQNGERELLTSASETTYSNVFLLYIQYHGANKALSFIHTSLFIITVLPG